MDNEILPPSWKEREFLDRKQEWPKGVVNASLFGFQNVQILFYNLVAHMKRKSTFCSINGYIKVTGYRLLMNNS
jgi:hypothetical protein